MHSSKTAFSVAAFAIAVALVSLTLIGPSTAQEQDGGRSSDDASLRERVQFLEQRVNELEAIVRAEREEQHRAEVVELIREAHRKTAMDFAQMAREYAHAVSENASPDELARQQRSLHRHCELLQQIGHSQQRALHSHHLNEAHLVCPMHPEGARSDKPHCEICGMEKVPAELGPRENESSR